MHSLSSKNWNAYCKEERDAFTVCSRRGGGRGRGQFESKTERSLRYVLARGFLNRDIIASTSKHSQVI